MNNRRGERGKRRRGEKGREFSPLLLFSSSPLPSSAWLSLPLYFFLTLALLYPLLRILWLGFGEGLTAALNNPYYWGRLVWSLTYGLSSSLLCILLALPLAYAFRYRFPGRELLLSLATLPFVLPTIVVGIGFISLVGPRGLLGVNLYGTPWILLWASVFYNLGLVLRLLVGLLPGLEAPLATARTLGATPLRAYLRVGIPLLLPGLLSGGSLVFLYSFTSFGVPLLLGGPQWATLEVATYQALAQRLDFPEATALILMQLLVSGLVLWGYLRLGRRYAVGLKPRFALRPLSQMKAWVLALGVGVCFVLLYAPLLALLVRALGQPQAFVSIWTSEDFTPAGLALGNTLKFAGLAMLLVFPLGMLYAYAVWRGNRVLDGLGLLPLVVSPVAVGLGYLLAYPGFRGSLLILIAAYALLSYPLLARAFLPALRAMPRSIGEAARVLGAVGWRRFWRVDLPLLAPALASGGALALVAVMGEFGATLVLQRPEWATLSVAIYERLGRPGNMVFSEAVVLGALFGFVTIVMLIGTTPKHR